MASPLIYHKNSNAVKVKPEIAYTILTQKASLSQMKEKRRSLCAQANVVTAVIF